MHSKYIYRPIPNVSPATKVRLREHFTAEYSAADLVECSALYMKYLNFL